MGVDRFPVQLERAERARDREPRRLVEARGEAAEQDLDGRASLVVAQQPVAQAQGRPVERAGRAHPDVGEARAAEVFDHGERTGVQDAQTHGTSTNRTAVPGASRAGGSAAGSQSRASVDPMSCQPPGLERG